MTAALPVRACRRCGCTDDQACFDNDLGACFWVEEDLCSHCLIHRSVNRAAFVGAFVGAVAGSAATWALMLLGVYRVW